MKTILATLAPALLLLSSLAAAETPAPGLSKADADLLDLRRAVWVAWFAGDVKTLQRLLPADGVYVSPGSHPWETTASTIANAQQFRDGGGKLVRLEFPKNEIRRYGDLALIHTTYVYELESGGKRHAETGKAIEVFVRKDGVWIHPSWWLVRDEVPAKADRSTDPKE